MSTEDLKEISNPFSAGGGGISFEIRLQAALLIQMLINGYVPGLPHWPIKKIKLQGKYDGFDTDDCIVFLEDSESGQKAKALIQFKHTIRFTAGDETLREVLNAAWSDFTSQTFERNKDIICSYTEPLTATDSQNVRPLMEWARQSADSAEFFKKVQTAKFSSHSKRNKLEVFSSHLKEANEGKSLSEDQVYTFLCHFHLLGFDYDIPEGSALSLLRGQISAYTDSDPSSVFSQAIAYIQGVNQAAGTITKEKIPDDLKKHFSKSCKTEIARLQENGEIIRKDINNKIGDTHLNRSHLIAQVTSLFESKSLVYITGNRGSGKSALVSDYLETLPVNTPIFYFRAEDFNQSRLDKFFQELGVTLNLKTLSEEFALFPTKYIVIESLEKVLELDLKGAFKDLLNYIATDKSWRLIVSGRNYAFQAIQFAFLDEIEWGVVDVRELTAEELKTLLRENSELALLLENKSLSNLFNNLFWLKLGLKVIKAGGKFTSNSTEDYFKECVWTYVISNETDQTGGIHLKRKNLFIKISVQRSRDQTYGIPTKNLDSEVLQLLMRDGLIKLDTSKNLVSPAHDVLEDWALEYSINEKYNQTGLSDDFFIFLGTEPSRGRAFRLWLQGQLRNNKFKRNVVEEVVELLKNELAPHLQDEIITAILLSPDIKHILQDMKFDLLKDQCEFLKRFCFMIRISCKTANENGQTSPNGKCWDAFIEFIYEYRKEIDSELRTHILPVLNEWSERLSLNKDTSEIGRSAGLLSLYLLEFVKDSYRQDDEDSQFSIFKLILMSIPYIREEFEELINRDVLTENQPSYVRRFLDASLNSYLTIYFCKHAPELVVKVAKKAWLMPIDYPKRGWGSSKVEESFGLYEFGGGTNFFPASAIKGPFSSLLRFNFDFGVQFILELCNHSAEHFAKASLDGPDKDGRFSTGYSLGISKVELQIPSMDLPISQYCSHRLWSAYRGKAVVAPYLLQSALMALENYLIEFVSIYDKEMAQSFLFDIMSRSNSVLVTSIIASLANAFPNKLPNVALVLLKVPDFYYFDLLRSMEENSPTIGFGPLDKDPLKELYVSDREKSDKREWRKKNLEFLAFNLQLTGYAEEINKILDEFNTAPPESLAYSSNSIEWRALLQRLDLRKQKPVLDEERNQISFEPTEAPPELKESQNKADKKITVMNRFLKLESWSKAKLNYEKLETEYFLNWKDAFAEAKELIAMINNREITNMMGTYIGAIVKTAAVIIRDYANENELSSEWCSSIILEAVSDSFEQQFYNQTDLYGSSSAAEVLPILLDFVEDDKKGPKKSEYIKALILIAITHENSSISEHTAKGISSYLWSRDYEMSNMCLNSSLEYAKLKLEHAFDRFREDADENWKEKFIKSIAAGNFKDLNIDEISLKTHSGWNLLTPIFILPDGSTDKNHVALWKKYIMLIIEEDSERRRYDSSNQRRNELPVEFHTKLPKRFAQYILEAPVDAFRELLEDIVETLPTFINSVFLQIRCIAEQRDNIKLYWEYWDLLEKKFEHIAKSPDCSEELLHTLLYLPSFDLHPEEHLLIDGVDRLINFIEKTGKHPTMFGALSYLAYAHPKLFMPKALNVLAKLKNSQTGNHLMLMTNTVYYLEIVIRRYLLNRPDGNQMSKNEKENCMILLNSMVSTGSANAYILREYLLHSKI